jgi:phenylacetaldehyde dehydrogenase
MTPSQRGKIIWIIADRLEENLEEFANLESLDNGKPQTVARVADVPLAVDIFRYMAGWATKIEGHTIPISVPYAPGGRFFAYTLREPVGVVGQIIPWNFPLLMAAWKLAPALAAGCTVVLKPAEQTPLSQPFFGHSGLDASMKAFPSDSKLSERRSLINDGGSGFGAPTEPSHDGVRCRHEWSLHRNI